MRSQRMINFVKLLFLFYSVSNANGFDLSKHWNISCNSLQCKTGLETCISSNCLGVRACKAILDEYFPTCTPCVRDILDSSFYELVDGNYYPTCDSSVDLHVTICLFYCRANWFQSGACVNQNNIPICKCGIESTTTATTTISTSSITTTTQAPFGSLLLTLNGNTSTVLALTVLENGYLFSG